MTSEWLASVSKKSNLTSLLAVQLSVVWGLCAWTTLTFFLMFSETLYNALGLRPR